MSNQYRTDDQDFLRSTREFLSQHARDPVLCWKAIKRYLYLDDLQKHAIALSGGTPVQWGYGNLLTKLVLVVPSMEDADRIAFFKRLILPMELDFNQVYITAYQKADSLPEDRLSRLLELELNAIKPDMVVYFGDVPKMNPRFRSLDFSDTDIRQLHVMMKESDKGVRQANDPELREAKNKFWIKIRSIIPFFDDCP